jgi:hypothetical protein
MKNYLKILLLFTIALASCKKEKTNFVKLNKADTSGCVDSLNIKFIGIDNPSFVEEHYIGVYCGCMDNGRLCESNCIEYELPLGKYKVEKRAKISVSYWDYSENEINLEKGKDCVFI